MSERLLSTKTKVKNTYEYTLLYHSSYIFIKFSSSLLFEYDCKEKHKKLLISNLIYTVHEPNNIIWKLSLTNLATVSLRDTNTT